MSQAKEISKHLLLSFYVVHYNKMLVVLLKAGQKALGGGETFLAELHSIQVILFLKKKSTQFKASQFSNKFTLRPIMTTFSFFTDGEMG